MDTVDRPDQVPSAGHEDDAADGVIADADLDDVAGGQSNSLVPLPPLPPFPPFPG